MHSKWLLPACWGPPTQRQLLSNATGGVSLCCGDNASAISSNTSLAVQAAENEWALINTVLSIGVIGAWTTLDISKLHHHKGGYLWVTQQSAPWAKHGIYTAQQSFGLMVIFPSIRLCPLGLTMLWPIATFLYVSFSLSTHPLHTKADTWLYFHAERTPQFPN